MWRLNLTGNLWFNPDSKFVVGGSIYHSLDALRKATSFETSDDGKPTGTDADPHVAPSSFFQSCVRWRDGYPRIPNSAVLDELRGFPGC